jgi:hypothetical protein
MLRSTLKVVTVVVASAAIAGAALYFFPTVLYVRPAY